MNNENQAPVLQFKDNQDPNNGDTKNAKIGRAVNELMVRNNELEKINSGIKEKLQVCKIKIPALEARITELETKVTDLEAENTRLRETKPEASSGNQLMNDLEAKLQSANEAKKEIVMKYALVKNLLKQFSGGNLGEEPVEIIKGLAGRMEELKREKEEAVLEMKEKLKNIENGKTAMQVSRGKKEREYAKEEAKVERRGQGEEEEDVSAIGIDAESMMHLLQGNDWKIKVKDWSEYQKKNKEKSVKIAALGCQQTGKSWILRKLLGYEDYYGKAKKTNGLCVLYPKDENKMWTAFDTLGTNMAIQTESMRKDMEDYIEERELGEGQVEKMLNDDRVAVEKMIQEFVLSHAEILLIVVGKLRRDDQRFIREIKKRKDLGGKRIIIVHDLMDLKEVEDVEEVIAEDIVNTFDAYERVIDISENCRDKNKIVYSESGSRKIEHVVMAKDGSSAGDYYNDTAIAYLKQIISIGDLSKNFDLVKEFADHLNKHFKEYLALKSLTPGADLLVVNTNDEKVPLGLKLGQPEDCRWKEFEEESKTGDIPYTVKFTTKKDCEDGEEERYVQIEFELTGACDDKLIKSRVEMNQDEIVIKVKGKSNDNTKRDDDDDICHNSRRFGEFQIVTKPIALKNHAVHRNEKGMINNDIPGVKVISWRLYPIEDEPF